MLNVKRFVELGNPKIMLNAIVATRDTFASEKPLGTPVGSDEWVYNTRTLRPYLLFRIKEQWSALADQNPEQDCCPFNDDTIVHLWVAARKDQLSESRIAGM